MDAQVYLSMSWGFFYSSTIKDRSAYSPKVMGIDVRSEKIHVTAQLLQCSFILQGACQHSSHNSDINNWPVPGHRFHVPAIVELMRKLCSLGKETIDKGYALLAAIMPLTCEYTGVFIRLSMQPVHGVLHRRLWSGMAISVASFLGFLERLPSTGPKPFHDSF